MHNDWKPRDPDAPTPPPGKTNYRWTAVMQKFRSGSMDRGATASRPATVNTALEVRKIKTQSAEPESPAKPSPSKKSNYNFAEKTAPKDNFMFQNETDIMRASIRSRGFNTSYNL